MMPKRSIACLLAVVSMLALVPPALAADPFPTRPITLLVAMAPGGFFDVQARLLADILEKHLGKPIVVNNMPGTNGAIMLDYLMRQKPDGYTLALSGGSYIVSNPYIEKVNYTYKDFTYVHAYSLHPQNLAVRTEAPWKTFKEFVEHVKKNPGKVRYATWAPTSTVSLMMRIIAKQANLDWIHVPYKGDAPSITAILGGHVDAVGLSATVVPYARSGKLRILAVFTKDRWKDFPDIPTVRELGYDVPPLTDWTSMSGVIGPRGLTGPVYDRIEAAFTKAFQDPAFLALMAKFNVPVFASDGKAYERMMAEGHERLGQVLPPLLREVGKD